MNSILKSFLLLTVLFTVFNTIECKKPVGRCVDEYGYSKCSFNQLCVRGGRECNPIDEHRSCMCKTNKVKGCLNIIKESVCQSDEICQDIKKGKMCRNPKSKKCKCMKSAPVGKGCKVYIDQREYIVPLGARNHRIPETCQQCTCLDVFKTGQEPFLNQCRRLTSGCHVFKIFAGRK